MVDSPTADLASKLSTLLARQKPRLDRELYEQLWALDGQLSRAGTYRGSANIAHRKAVYQKDVERRSAAAVEAAQKVIAGSPPRDVRPHGNALVDAAVAWLAPHLEQIQRELNDCSTKQHRNDNLRIVDREGPQVVSALRVELELLIGRMGAAPSGTSTDPASYDSRLQLLRREKFDADLPAAVAAAFAGNTPLALIMLDLDGFKTINDSHGHQVGDEVLVAVATLLNRVVGSKGACYKFGGDELCVLLPNYVAEEAAALAERLRIEVCQSPLSSQEIRLTASLGVAELPSHASTAAELIKAADNALYQAKGLRRNLVRVAGEPSVVVVATPWTAARRQPDIRGLSDEAAEAIRRSYFTIGNALCPNDGVPLEITRSDTHNRQTPTLLVSCPACGLRETLQGLS